MCVCRLSSPVRCKEVLGNFCVFVNSLISIQRIDETTLSRGIYTSSFHINTAAERERERESSPKIMAAHVSLFM